MPAYHEIQVALNELEALERKLKNPGGPIEDILAVYALRIATASLETINLIGQRTEISVSTQ
jgi:hypothetical protein